MPIPCSITGCFSRIGDTNMGIKLKFFKIPSPSNSRGIEYPLRRRRHEAWLKAIGKSDLEFKPWKNIKVCERHFHFGKPCRLEFSDHRDWAPSLLLNPWDEERMKGDSDDDFTWATDNEMFKDDKIKKVKNKQILNLHQSENNRTEHKIAKVKRKYEKKKPQKPNPLLNKTLLVSQFSNEKVIITYNRNVTTTAELVLPTNGEDNTEMILGI